MSDEDKEAFRDLANAIRELAGAIRATTGPFGGVQIHHNGIPQAGERETFYPYRSPRSTGAGDFR